MEDGFATEQKTQEKKILKIEDENEEEDENEGKGL